MKLIKASIAMVAFAALFVVPSVASAVQLTHPTGTTAPVGTKIQATNVAHAATGKVTKMKTPIGTVECATATLTGELTANAANGATVEGEITTAEFRGKPDANEPEVKPHSDVADCRSPFGDVQVTPNHTTNPCHTPTGGTAHCSLPWCVRAGAEDSLTVVGTTTGKKCAKEFDRRLTFTLHITGLGSCSYEDEGAVGVTGIYTTHPNAAVATINKQLFKRITGSSLICPATGELDMAFTLEDDTAPPYKDVYIDKL